MGAYDNPRIIRDTSGQIYGQAIANLGQQIGAGLTKAFAKEEAEKEKAKKEIERQQRIAYGVEDKMYQEANKNYAKLSAKDPSLVDKFKIKVNEMLNGTDQSLGAIKAATLLAIKTDLTPEERQQYRSIVQKAQAFQISAVEGGGKIISDLQDVDGINAGGIATTHAWVGAPGLESDTSMLTYYALSNKQPEGLTGVADLESDEDGSMIVSVNSKIDKNSELFKSLDPETQAALQSNNYELTWKRNINKWNEGLIEEIPKKANYDEIAQNLGFISDGSGTTKKGQISPDYVYGKENSIQNIEYEGKNVPVRYINVDGFLNGPAFQGDIDGKAAGINRRGEGQVSSYMRYKMLKGEFNVGKFKKLTQPEQLQEIKNAITEDFKRVKLQDLIKRNATSKDVANLKALGIEAEIGQPVYLEQAGKAENLKSNEYIATLGDKIVDEVMKIPITPIQTVSGLSGGEDAPKKNADIIRNQNIEKHKKYLRSKGINAKSKAELVSQLEKAKGTKDGDGNKIDDDYIEAFKSRAQNLYVYDAENKKQYELPSYNPESNESLLPILNEYGGFGSKTKERLSTTILP